MQYSVSIDVPQIDEGLRFYRDALVERNRTAHSNLCDPQVRRLADRIIEKREGSKPARGANDVRRYERHWTPVHIDFHVDDFDAFLERALSAGAKLEQKFAGGGRPATAFCSNPFGNGFCVIGRSG
jgi:predicted enzyme related to lactoylglutathione lyase